MKRFADETRAALEHWFESLQSDGERNARVEANLHTLARVQPKTVVVGLLTEDGDQLLTEDGHRIVVDSTFSATSST